MATIDELLAAVQTGDTPAVQRALDKDSTLLTARNSQGLTPFLAALYSRQGEVADLLLSKGLQLDFFEAAAAGNIETVEDRLAASPQLLQTHSPDGWTALHLASFFGQRGAVSALLERGADVLAWSTNGLKNQPLHAAVAGRSAEVVTLLLERGADVNSRQNGGFTALQGAAANGQAELVKLLLSHGADATVANEAGGTALSLAEAKNHSEIVALLEAGPLT